MSPDRFRCGFMSSQHDRPTYSEWEDMGVTQRNNAHRTCEMISSSDNLQSWRWETLALTREVLNNRAA